MNARSQIIFLALSLAGSNLTYAQDSLPRLDDALKAVAAFEYGKDPAPLLLVEQIVIDSAKNPSQRTAVEDKLLKTLAEPATTRDGKEVICRQLFTIGSARSVPQLEALLTDPPLSHVARLALGRNEDLSAAEALLRALEKTSGKLQAGVLNTLGDRRFAKALPKIGKLLNASDPVVADAAATALGKLGGAEAVKALQAARSVSSQEVRERIDQALLASADRFLLEGQVAEADRIFEKLYAPKQPKNLRLAALRGLVTARGHKALPLLVRAIKENDSSLRTGAIGFSRTAKGAQISRELAGLLPSLPPDAQELLLQALAERGDAAAETAAVLATKSEHQNVRVAAYQALSVIGDSLTVLTLIDAAANKSGPEQETARASLLKLKAGGANQILMLQSLASPEDRIQVEAIRALAGRHASSALEPLLDRARHGKDPVRREAIRGLGQLVDERSFSKLVRLTADCENADDLAMLEQANSAALRRIPHPEKQVAPLLDALNRVAPANKPVLLRLLAQTGTEDALAAVREAVKDKDSTVSDGAIRALADWPNAAPAEDLLTLARSADQLAQKILALRGYIRMASLAPDPAARYARAMELAQRPEDKKAVLSSLGEAEPALALRIVEPYLQDDQLRNEAALAAVQIADRLRPSDPTRASALLKSAMAATDAPRIRMQAQEVMNQLAPLEGHILQWLGAGPFRRKDKDASALFDIVFSPERQGATDVRWEPLTKGIGTWDINLYEALGGDDDVVAYVKTRVWSPIAQDARLELGSDDGIKAWLNGALVDAKNVERGLAPRQDIAPIQFKQGWNDLLLKIINRAGGWAFACRIRQPDGSPLEGLKVEAK